MFFSAIIFGLLGSFHCIGMCGPIAFLLPLDRLNRSRRLLQIFLYHAGRLTAYAIIGLASGLLGKSLGLFGLQQQLSIIIGVIMLILVLIPKRKLGKLDPEKGGFKLAGVLKNRLGKELKKKSPDTFYSVGFLNGFLPCGLVYIAVFGAIASGNALQGSFYMLLFGVGTIPLMTSAIWLSNIISVKSRKYIRRLVPVFVGLMAIMFILRGLGLGIPYVSPKQQTEQVSSEYECHKPMLITKS
ncbi:sulfite exporter TauE/SafE family protein [Pontixanthobacter gangjinensis]|uniref:Sulfite exporter TauE/SafE family protein n=1 Tax=Christiangramia aestuarii TaxID=1028746 RepID=A0A7K1LQH1_9FLAO|nr:sulfite exporter TauE/SafE family protein [Christiangramia aestuarii]MUP43059.1 sulfite exporter TauE/SafE family protein [Christiangramia aestuarii]